MYEKFVNTFNSDEVITTNRYADTVIGILNDEDKIEDFNMEEATKPMEKYSFFEVKELNNNYDNFLKIK